MKGKWPVLAILGSALMVGGGVWYTQQYAYYETIDPAGPGANISALSTADGRMVELPVADFQGIDAGSSPIRWRSCFQLTEPPLPGSLVPYDDPKPAYGPNWFDCFDADRIGDDLESGAAMAVLGVSEIRPDTDRVLAIYPDGRAYGWHQYNDKTPERGVMD